MVYLHRCYCSLLYLLFYGFLINSIEASPPLREKISEWEERAEVIEEHVLNETLAKLLDSDSNDPAILEKISNVYSKLNQEGWSILYQQRAQLVKEKNRSFYFRFFYQGFAILSFLLLFLLSIYAFLSNSNRVKIILFNLVAFYAILSIVLSLKTMQKPILGVLISSTGLYRLPSMQEAQLADIPLVEGQLIEILALDSNHEWTKILTSSDEAALVGYVPTSLVRPIEFKDD